MNASRDGEVAFWEALEALDFFEGREFDLEREREREVVLFLVAEREERLRAEVDGAIIFKTVCWEERILLCVK